MKAFQISRPRTFNPVEVPKPELPPTDLGKLLIKTRYASICGSDIPFFTGAKQDLNFPLKPGAHVHECVGQIAQSNSEDFSPGDAVLAIPEEDLGLAEYFIAQESKTIPLPLDIAVLESSTIIQPLSTVLNAIDRLKITPDSNIAVIGLGSIGLLFCWALNKQGVNQIVGIDPSPERCDFAKSLAVHRTICGTSRDVVYAQQSDPDFWISPDICIEAVGHQTDTVNDALNLIRKRGTVLAFGVPDQDNYTLDYERFFRQNAEMIAAVTPDWKPYLMKALKLFQTYPEELGEFYTHRFPISDVQQAFSHYEKHQNGIIKTIIDFTDW
jgi:L-iditol 2-dehydrogenase